MLPLFRKSTQRDGWSIDLQLVLNGHPLCYPRMRFGLYEALCGDRFEKLREWGDTFLGAVTGNNQFFALTAAEACNAGLSEKDLVKISPPGARHLRGLNFSEKAWKCLRDEGKKCYLFSSTSV